MEKYSSYRHQHPTYTVTERSLEGADGNVLRFHQRYEVVPSNFLYHLFGRQYMRDVSLNLRKGTYIGFPDVPIEERAMRLPRNAHYLTTLKPRGEAIVGEPPRDNDQLPHKTLRCKCEILLDHGPFSVRLPQDILAHKDCPPATRKLKSPFSIPLSPRLRPDITRGFSNGEDTVFVHIEVDRATERMSERDEGSSIEDKIIRYVEYLDHDIWKSHFGFRVPPSVLFLTTRQDTRKLEALIRQHAKNWYDRFYWLSIPRKPLPTHDLFVPWQGVDGTLDLKELLNVRHDESGAHQNARS